MDEGAGALTRARRLALPRPAAETRRILKKLQSQQPGADTALRYRNPFELLVATILSAQTTDERVNQVTPALFARYPDAAALARAKSDELERLVQSTGFFRSKARSLLGMAQALVARHAGQVPAAMDALVELPGVGRKTANVVLGHALGVPGLAVDRHVLRVANRLGIARSDDPEVVEQQLTAALPPRDWTLASDTLILHGRRICKPRPLCDRCAARDLCFFYRRGQGSGARGSRGSPPPKRARGAARGMGDPASDALGGVRGSPPPKRVRGAARGMGGPASDALGGVRGSPPFKR